MQERVVGVIRWAVGLAAALLLSGAAAEEVFHYEKTVVGPIIALKDLNIGERDVRIDMKFKLDKFNARMGKHLVVAIGDLTRYYNRGVAPIGEGVVIGASDYCPDTSSMSAMTESLYSGRVLEPATCFSNIDVNTVYDLAVTVTVAYDITYELRRDGVLLTTQKRTWQGVHPWHTRGLFFVPVSDANNGAVDLLRLTATTVN